MSVEARKVLPGDMLRVGGHVEVVERVLRTFDGRVLFGYVSGAAGCLPASGQVELLESAAEHEAWARASSLEAAAARFDAALDLLEGRSE